MKRDNVMLAVIELYDLPEGCDEVLLDDVNNPTRIIFKCGGAVSYTPQLSRGDTDELRKRVAATRAVWGWRSGHDSRSAAGAKATRSMAAMTTSSTLSKNMSSAC